MPLPPLLSEFVRTYSEALLLALLAVVAALVVALLIVIGRLSRLNRVYARLTRGTSGRNLEEVLHGHMDTVSGVVERVEALEQASRTLSERQDGCLSRVGVVRFDAFEDVGGEQSFAVALLDNTKSGVLVSTVYSRSDTRVFAKGVVRGAPTHPLTQEERLAMARADGSRDTHGG